MGLGEFPEAGNNYFSETGEFLTWLLVQPPLKDDYPGT
jgi:hypothetical protein